jgi:hypothetical protein
LYHWGDLRAIIGQRRQERNCILKFSDGTANNDQNALLETQLVRHWLVATVL